MPHCIVKGCKNVIQRRSLSRLRPLPKKNERTKGKITYHHIPKDPIRRQKWIKALQLDVVKEHDHVCSDHFPEDAFDRTSLCCVRLREHAVPNINLKKLNPVNESWQILDTNTVESRESDSLKYEINELHEDTSQKAEPVNLLANTAGLLVSSKSCDINDIQNKFQWNVSFEFANESTPRVSLLLCFDKPCTNPLARSVEEKLEEVRTPDKCVVKKTYTDRTTSVSPERIFSSPVKEAICEHYENKLRERRKQFKALSEKLRRTQFKTNILSNLLSELKSLHSKKIN